MSSIIYRVNNPTPIEDLCRIYDSSGIRRPTQDIARIKKMYANSNLVVTAWDEARLIGVSRAVTDFSYCCYVSDIDVDNRYKSQGVGKELLRITREAAGGESVTFLLLAAPTAQSYYRHLGYEKNERCFSIPRIK